MKKRKWIIIAGVLVAIIAIVVDFLIQTPGELKRNIEDKHPSTYYILPGVLMEEEKMDEATFWFYLCQLRYRFHLLVNEKNLDPSGDPALFGAFNFTFGLRINGYAFGDIDSLAETIDEVIMWDSEHKNGFTPKEGNESKHKEVVNGLLELRDTILADANTIRRERLEHGLGNRS